MSKLKCQLDYLEKKIDREEEKKERTIKKYDDKISALRQEKRKIEWRLSYLEKARQKRCKHDGEIGKRSCQRDDASFEFYLYCKKCKMDVGYQNFDGSVYYDVPIGQIEQKADQ